jgi:hypothetical protein
MTRLPPASIVTLALGLTIPPTLLQADEVIR